MKAYLSEKAATERLKKSIISKSGLLRSKTILESKKSKIKRIHKLALKNRGGQFDNVDFGFDFSDFDFETMVENFAYKIREMVERLAIFLKERELKGILKIFFREGRLILELILLNCNVDISYGILGEGLNTQVIVFTATAGGFTGFVLAWFSVGASLVAPPLLILWMSLRSISQQITNYFEYKKFKGMMRKMLKDNELKEELKDTLRAIFVEGEDPIFTKLKMEPTDLENPILKHDFSLESSEERDTFIKEKLKEKLGLIENPTEKQLEEIIQKKVMRKPKKKTVYFYDFIEKVTDYESDLDILDAEIIQEPIRVRTDKEL